MSPTRTSRRGSPRRRFRLRRPTWRGWFAIGLGAVVAAVVAAWAIDYATLGDRVARNVTVAEVNLGRHAGAGLDAVLERADTAYGEGTVVFVVDGEEHRMSAGQIGLHLDDAATRKAAQRIGRDDPVLLKPVYWVTSFFQSRRVPVTVTLDRSRLSAALASLPGQIQVVEPRVIGSVETVGTTPGRNGYGFDPDTVARRIERQAHETGLPLRIPLAASIIEPQVSEDEVKLLAAHARTLTDQDIDLSIPGAHMVANPPLLRSWITSEVDARTGKPRLAMNAESVVRDLRDELGTKITDPIPATFTVEDTEVYLVPQVDGLDCCAESSGAVILEALEAAHTADHSPEGDGPDDPEVVELPLVERPPEFTTAKARALGITTRLGVGERADPQRLWRPGTTTTTTTVPGSDPAATATTSTSTSTTTTTTPSRTPTAGDVEDGQFVVPIPGRTGQVANVDEAIGSLNGRIILPGEKLSLNQVIGAPSPERGFVPADVQTADGPTWISGGGTDLVAAALFEAAYHVGLDIPTSTRHRVLPEGVTPGIEATLGWTEPDLVVVNPSDHGILVWVDRVGQSVRVQLFGTPFVRTVDTDTREKPFGPRDACLSVRVERTRTFLGDRDEKKDRFEARYTPPPGARDDPNRVICPDE